MNRTLREVLSAKGRFVFAVLPSATVAVAVRLMNQRHIGSVLVIDDGAACGIFTERDVLSRVVEPNLDPDLTSIAQVMTRCPTCASSSTTVGEAMKLMTMRRERHLPVSENGRVVGVLSIGDLVHDLGCELEHQVEDLTCLIRGPYARPVESSLPPPPWPPVSKRPLGVAA